MVCAFCGNDINHYLNKKCKNYFCNKSCAAKYNNSIKPKRTKIQAFCKDCGTQLSKNTVQRCRECFIKSRTLALISNITVGELKEICKDKRLSSFASKIRGYGLAVYNQSDKPKYCIMCGYNKHYEVCHIKAVSSFSDDTLLSEVHDINNLIALCPNCHWEFDRGLIERAAIA